MTTETNLWITLVTYNDASCIRQCLEHVLAGTVVPNIVLVDNASTDATIDIAISTFPDIHIIRNYANHGYGHAVNRGMVYALNQGADVLLWLNPDATLEADAVMNLLKAHHNHPDYGILFPMIFNHSSDRIECFFRMELVKYLPESFFRESANVPGDHVYEVHSLPAAAMMIRRDALEDFGAVDPLFFVLGIEYDLCSRAWYAGWKVGLVPNAVIRHTYLEENEPANAIIGSSTRQTRKNSGFGHDLDLFFRAVSYTNLSNMNAKHGYIPEFYSTFLVILKRQGLPFFILIFSGFCFYFLSIILSLMKFKIQRVSALLSIGPKLLAVLPRVKRHRKLCRTRKGAFLWDDLVIESPLHLQKE